MNSRKKSIIIALMVAMFLGAIEGTVVTTAIPTIVKDLHGFQIMSLVFSVYLLSSAISTPIYGKLSDLYGRKNILSIGIIIFLLGSFLCGLSYSMYMLIASRAIQGLGAGAIFTVTYTIVGDVYTLEERPKVQGSLGTVWGVASLLGPFLGGFLIDTLSWHWVFFINIPFGILSIILLQKSLTETFEKKKPNIDVAGIITLSIAMVVFLNIFLSKDTKSTNHTIFVGLSAVASILLIGIFYRIERRAKEPLIPFDIFTKESVIINVISFLISTVLIATDVYMPIYLQNILGHNATVSGLVLAPMSVSWLISSVVLGKLILKQGAKAVIFLSNSIILISIVLLTTLNIHSSLSAVIIYCIIMGFGLGGAFTTLTIVVQSSVEYNKRGAATATNSLLRTLGQTIGVGIFGAIFNVNIIRYFSKIGIKGINPSNLYTLTKTNPSVTSEEIKLSLNSSIHVLFFILIMISILCLILTIVLPKKTEMI